MGTLRSSDHVELDERGFKAKLSHSKTLGSDRSVTMRLVVVNKSCVIKRVGWLTTGWSLMRQESPFDRDYLLPVPTGNHGSCKKQELKYAVGSAIQTGVLSILKVGGEPLFRHRVVHYWAPHSGRNFLPSATGALGCPKAGTRRIGRMVRSRQREIHEAGQTAYLNDAGSRCESISGHCKDRPVVPGRIASEPRGFHARVRYSSLGG